MFIRVTPATHQIRYNTAEHNWAGTVATISTVYIHPQYEQGQLANNIALLRIRESFPRSIYKKVAFRCPGSEVDGEKLLVAGWGWLRDQSGQLSTQLRQVALPYAGSACARYYESIEKTIDEKMFCAGDLDHGGAGICNGDEGGAAVKKGKRKNYVIGIASYVYDCGQPKMISVFTFVSSYSEWIKSILGYFPDCNVLTS